MQRPMTSRQILHFMNGAWLGESIDLQYRVPLVRILFLVYSAHLEGNAVLKRALHEFATVPERVSWRISVFAIERRWIKVERRRTENRPVEYVVPTKTLIHMIDRELDDLTDVVQKEA